MNKVLKNLYVLLNGLSFHWFQCTLYWTKRWFRFKTRV